MMMGLNPQIQLSEQVEGSQHLYHPNINDIKAAPVRF